MGYRFFPLALCVLALPIAPAGAQIAPSPVIQYPNITASQAGLTPRTGPDTQPWYADALGPHWNERGPRSQAVLTLSRSQRSALWALERRDFSSALVQLRTLASADDPWANRHLGWLYVRGLGVPRDKGLAFQYFHEAARHGDAPSALAVGHAFQLGDGVERNPALADYWLGRAAQSGDRHIRRDAVRLMRRN